MEYFDILDYNPLFSDVHCGLSVHLHTNVNKNTTTQDIGQGSNPIHIKWNAAKQSEFATVLSLPFSLLFPIYMFIFLQKSNSL
jgi:hypothetical protein